jgi:GNAT superfamily N-acetyltransferase
MTIDVAEEPITALAEYALLPIAFPVDQVLDVTARAEGGFALSARRLKVPYVKHYDAVDGEGPLHWSRRFDVSNWTLFTARVADSRVGGATVAFDTPGLTMLEGRRDLSVLWDIRVAPNARGKGIGSALFEKVEAWARAHSCRQLKVETQNIKCPRAGFMHDTGASSERSTMPRILNCRGKSN